MERCAAATAQVDAPRTAATCAGHAATAHFNAAPPPHLVEGATNVATWNVATTAASTCAAPEDSHDGGEGCAHPLIAHADALRAAGSTEERVQGVLLLGAADVAAPTATVATRTVQAAAVARTHAALTGSRALDATTTAHGAGVFATATLAPPKHSSGLPLKKLGLHGVAVTLSEAAFDWDSAVEVPGATASTLLGSGALVNAGCQRCSNLRISKVEWCAAQHGHNVYFTLTRRVKRGDELLLHYKVRGARCKCRRSLHF